MTKIDIFLAICDERKRQEILWGWQNYPIISGARGQLTKMKRLSLKYKKYCDKKAKKKCLTWKDILLEEVYEVFSEEDENKQKEELIQVASVVVQMLENYSRKEVDIEDIFEVKASNTIDV